MCQALSRWWEPFCPNSFVVLKNLKDIQQALVHMQLVGGLPAGLHIGLFAGGFASMWFPSQNLSKPSNSATCFNNLVRELCQPDTWALVALHLLSCPSNINIYERSTRHFISPFECSFLSCDRLVVCLQHLVCSASEFALALLVLHKGCSAALVTLVSAELPISYHQGTLYFIFHSIFQLEKITFLLPLFSSPLPVCGLETILIPIWIKYELTSHQKASSCPSNTW